MSLDAALSELNARLKAGHHRCCVERRKASLVLRATLVDRSDPSTRKRQRLALGLPADYASLPAAEAAAVRLGMTLRQGTFDWADWTQETQSEITAAEFRAAAQRLHASKYRGSPERGVNAWEKKWAPALRKLPASGVITSAVLLRVVCLMPAGSAARHDQGSLLAQVARSLGMDSAPLQAACRGYGAAQLTERDIPSDGAIEGAWEAIRLPHWRWTFGMCATFGLRPHECVELQWLPDDWVQVADNTKTGGRRVRACPGDWVERFKLKDLPRPTQSTSSIAQVLCAALKRARVPFRAYALRHAYALRLMDRGVPPELGARLMGHSLQMHEQCYKRWLEADRISKAMERFTNL
ncbi:hypothetical protein KBZ19_09155 [Synechococcus sp. L2F]|uniref:hypothetical protein n=1 Tax=Synechococcus sp. L2F TaxID=2823739 RepID=UPI0020CDF1CB|nr:hypothetical protein [Synechococcus sp. L2F]MCP9828653.1 hypothetical protein [Synechococcus sp. L2F]